MSRVREETIDHRNPAEVALDRIVHRAVFQAAFFVGYHQRVLIDGKSVEAGAARERPKRRWVESRPEAGLTWGRELRGDRFVQKVTSYGGFGGDASVLEIGPGYGRLLKAMLSADVPFEKYLGIDISQTNVDYLARTFPSSRVGFRQGDAETIGPLEPYDLLISSLTFKHLYPSFERGLGNLSQYAVPGALFIFDLIEGDEAFFEADGITFIRCYMKADVVEILDRVGLAVVAFDLVRHTPIRTRLLVVAQKPPPPAPASRGG